MCMIMGVCVGMYVCMYVYDHEYSGLAIEVLAGNFMYVSMYVCMYIRTYLSA